MEHIFELQTRTYQLRADCLRATSAAGSGHPTSCLSAADIVAALFFHSMRFDPSDYENPNNDRFILSKGHAAPLLYAAWKQFGKVTDQELMHLRSFNSSLEGHPTARFHYAEAATGSLGQGLSIGVGMALAARLTFGSAHQTQLPRTFVLLGDSEMTEGSNWEAFELAAHYHLTNLIALVDVNRLGQRGETLEGHDLSRLHQKCAAFGWHTVEVDGHDLNALVKVLDAVLAKPKSPIAILAKTIKGYGLDADIENKNGFHGKALSPEKLPFFMTKLAERFPQEAQEIAKNQLLAPPVNPPLRLAHHNYLIPTAHTECFGLCQNVSKCKLHPISTRKAYGEALTTLGAQNPHILSLDAEVKNSTYAELFETAFPERFFECFIAEQNMIGMAIGLTKRGWIPFTLTFGAFMTRAFDQIRMAGVGRVPLRLVGSHAGVSIGQDGPSQMALEDMAMIRTVPESIILYPCDAVSTAACVELMANYTHGISYLRTTREETPLVYQELSHEVRPLMVSVLTPVKMYRTREAEEVPHTFSIGNCCTLRASDKDCCCVVAAGITVFEALKAYEYLKKQNIFIRIIDCYSVKPLPLAQLEEAVKTCHGRLVTVEDHYYAGGLGESIIAGLAQRDTTILTKTESLSVTQLPRSGSREELFAFEGIDAAAIIAAVTRCCKKLI